MIIAVLAIMSGPSYAQSPTTIHCENPGVRETQAGYIKNTLAGFVSVGCKDFSGLATNDSELGSISFKDPESGKIYNVEASRIAALCGGSKAGDVFNPPVDAAHSTYDCMRSLKEEVSKRDASAHNLILDGADYTKMSLRFDEYDEFIYAVDAHTFSERCWYSNTKGEFYLNGSNKSEDKVCMDVGMICKPEDKFIRSLMYCKSLVKGEEACNISANSCHDQDSKNSPALWVHSDKTRPECRTFAVNLPLEELQKQILACLQISRSASSGGSGAVKEGQ